MWLVVEGKVQINYAYYTNGTHYHITGRITEVIINMSTPTTKDSQKIKIKKR